MNNRSAFWGGKSVFFYVSFVALLVMFFERLVFDRDLYADGACEFFRFFLNGKVEYYIPQRTTAFTLTYAPLSLAMSLGVNDIHLARVAFKLCEVFPFLVSFLSIGFLTQKYRDLGYFLFIAFAALFYIPNSIFSDGQHLVIFALFPPLISAIKEYLDIDTMVSKVLTFSLMVLMVLVYDPCAVIALLLATYLFLLKSYALYMRCDGDGFFRKISFVLRSNYSFFVLFLILLFYTYYGAISMPTFSRENMHSALTDYVFQPDRGLLSDSWMLFLSASVLALLLNMSSHTSSPLKGWKYISALLFVFSLACIFLFAGHMPVHALYSKTLYVPLSFVLSFGFILSSTDKLLKSIHLAFPYLTVILIASFLYVFNQGHEFGKYLYRFREVIESQPSSSITNQDALPFFHEPASKRYSWSWNHVCISKILEPSNNSLIEGEHDHDYFVYYGLFVKDHNKNNPSE